MEKQTFKISCEGAEKLPLNTILEYQDNIKKLSQRNYERLKLSILKYGFSAPIFIWKHQGNNYILDGHQRMKVLHGMRDEGFDIPLLPVAYIEAKTEKEAKEKRLHILSQYGHFCMQSLDEFLEDAGIGYEDIADSIRIEGIEKLLNPEATNGDDEYQERSPSISKDGDLWELGRHRLLCGSNTISRNIERLMNNQTAQMVFTDPPYGVSYSGDNNPNGRSWDVIDGDNLRGQELKNLLKQSFKNIFNHIADDCAIYICYASSRHILFEEALLEAGFKIRQQLIWIKHLVLGHSDYHWSHEPILYCSKESKSRWYGDRTAKTTILDSNKDDYIKIKKDRLIQIFLQLKSQATILDITKDLASEYIHPTQKPVELPLKAILNSSPKKGIVVDIFTGSGSTLIACEKADRNFYGLEIDPHYCDVIVDRYKTWCENNDRKIMIKRNGEKWEPREENPSLPNYD